MVSSSFPARWPAVILALACAAATVACAATSASAVQAAASAAPAPPRAAAPSPAPSGAAPAASSPLERMHAMTAASQCSTDADCRTLPIGARPCGGPEAYLPYSTKGTDVPALQALADKLAADRRAEIARTGEQGTCMFKPDPGAECRAQRCTLRRADLK